ncbi:MAG: hypothetical protein BA870_01370 [Desulfuromonadales bacterium C00003094]|jgi:hypothetical protein|nr:MAG: hypothetical protein BA870_01370 [Desulfuromonadales bacterium C00003094]
MGKDLIADLGRQYRPKASLLGRAITLQMRQKGGTSLYGHKIESSQDLAALAQAFRNPSYETLHFFYTKDGEVVGESATTKAVVMSSSEKDRLLSIQPGKALTIIQMPM